MRHAQVRRGIWVLCRPAGRQCPLAGRVPTDWQQGRGLGDPCHVYRVVCQALPLLEQARPALACGLHYY